LLKPPVTVPVVVKVPALVTVDVKDPATLVVAALLNVEAVRLAPDAMIVKLLPLLNSAPKIVAVPPLVTARVEPEPKTVMEPALNEPLPPTVKVLPPLTVTVFATAFGALTTA
jgi:hypothetical protein